MVHRPFWTCWDRTCARGIAVRLNGDPGAAAGLVSPDEVFPVAPTVHPEGRKGEQIRAASRWLVSQLKQPGGASQGPFEEFPPDGHRQPGSHTRLRDLTELVAGAAPVLASGPCSALAGSRAKEWERDRVLAGPEEGVNHPNSTDMVLASGATMDALG
jgi:hypothetical protein